MMRYLTFFAMFFLLSINCWAEAFFNFNNTVSTGKIIIDGQEISGDYVGGTKGNGKFKKQHRNISDFSIIRSNGTIDIFYTTGAPSLEIAADENILPLIQIEQQGNTLFIRTNQSFSSLNPLQVRLSSSKLNKGIFNGSGDIFLQNIKNTTLNLQLSGTGDLKASGKLSDLELVVNGSGDIDAKSLIADNVTVVSHGAADITITAKKNLNARQSGVGDIIFFGNPDTVKKQVFGMGDIVSGQ